MPLWLLFTAAGFYGGLAFSLYSLAVAHANDMARGQGLMEISAGLVLVWGAGAAAGPLIASGAMVGLGSWALFLYLSAILILLGGFALFRMTRRPAVPVEEQAPYVAMPRTTPEAVHLDPRYDEAEAAELAAAHAEAAAAETPPPDARP
jgi:MFS family permease